MNKKHKTSNKKDISSMIKLDGRMLGYNMIGQSESTHSSKQSFLIVSVSCVLEQTSFIMF